MSLSSLEAHYWACEALMARELPAPDELDHCTLVYETLNTVEDWDYEMRAMSVCGFRDTPKITAIYHRWRTGESSYTVHPESEWKENYRQVVDNYDKVPRIFPAGTAAHIRRQAELIDELRGEIHRLTVPAEVRTPMFRLRKFGARWRRRTIAAWRRIFGGLRGH